MGSVAPDSISKVLSMTGIMPSKAETTAPKLSSSAHPALVKQGGAIMYGSWTLADSMSSFYETHAPMRLKDDPELVSKLIKQNRDGLHQLVANIESKYNAKLPLGPPLVLHGSAQRANSPKADTPLKTDAQSILRSPVSSPRNLNPVHISSPRAQIFAEAIDLIEQQVAAVRSRSGLLSRTTSRTSSSHSYSTGTEIGADIESAVVPAISTGSSQQPLKTLSDSREVGLGIEIWSSDPSVAVSTTLSDKVLNQVKLALIAYFQDWYPNAVQDVDTIMKQHKGKEIEYLDFISEQAKDIGVDFLETYYDNQSVAVLSQSVDVLSLEQVVEILYDFVKSKSTGTISPDRDLRTLYNQQEKLGVEFQKALKHYCGGEKIKISKFIKDYCSEILRFEEKNCTISLCR